MGDVIDWEEEEREKRSKQHVDGFRADQNTELVADQLRLI